PKCSTPVARICVPAASSGMIRSASDFSGPRRSQFRLLLPPARCTTAMDTPKPPHKPAQLLHGLESIRELLGDNSSEPPLLIDSLDPDSIPVLSDIVSAPPGPPPPFHTAQAPKPAQAPGPTAPATATPAASQLREQIEPRLHESTRELQHLSAELRAAAQLILQDVIDDFVPQIEAELKRRLEARLPRLLPPRKP